MDSIDSVVGDSIVELEGIMNNWCNSKDANCSGGEMRGARGRDIEDFCKNVIRRLDSDAVAVKGSDDEKILTINHGDKTIKKKHQVDIHIYKRGKFIAVIECKAYLDSCYYERACNDFMLFKKFGYDIEKYIFSLEDGIDENTKIFTDVVTDNVCDDIFYVLDGKRSSAKPVYDKAHRKPINREKLTRFVNSMRRLLQSAA